MLVVSEQTKMRDLSLLLTKAFTSGTLDSILKARMRMMIRNNSFLNTRLATNPR